MAEGTSALMASSVRGTRVTNITFDFFADIGGGNTKLILVFTIGIGSALCANIGVIKTLIRLAHVVIVKAFLSVINFCMTGVII